MSSLWENNRMRVWKIEGRLTDIRIGAREPLGMGGRRMSAHKISTLFCVLQFGADSCG